MGYDGRKAYEKNFDKKFGKDISKELKVFIRGEIVHGRYELAEHIIRMSEYKEFPKEVIEWLCEMKKHTLGDNDDLKYLKKRK